jgi:hypothetical protein
VSDQRASDVIAFVYSSNPLSRECVTHAFWQNQMQGFAATIDAHAGLFGYFV